MIFLSTNLLGQDSPVTYWNEAEVPRQWQSFLNPNSIEFWKEGDYTPPTPLIMAMRDPTPSNIQLYKTYLKRRAAILDRFHKALKQERIDKIERIFVAFRSDCPACHRLLTRLTSQPEIHNRIQLLQVDDLPVPTPWPNLRLSQKSLIQLDIQAVPMVWVRQSGKLQRLSSAEQLFEEYL